MTGRVVRDNPEMSRYELVEDGTVIGFADYRATGSELLVPHTEILPGLRGQGLGAVLVEGMLEHLRRGGRSVVPRCWYVRQFLADHPGYEDLVAR